ncbi:MULTISPECIES: aromatic ring-hydroxylating oxygenase subunit alpha [Sphingobium]|uniref:aromatic ring-hydroxylating oxygenase subunit alpha n=1 Tax=Sphingobium TaxID=165695 RepID=UPI0015ECA5C0|nr:MULTISPECIES: SRPBCC family protein [Sphingobium]MCW2361838.1 benzoate/toluate 1,2-dioxygenase alpha subunit [Sphingobium sp. B10D3B]MCW2401483.1 benzoate/toluate 1,2-dioxygenase alpha subunit [Sphingobium sp. B10D7B]MCW2408463.1 benzoate/toluate 1,2-dioxygenase alpha subunit [Sphingobium xanthum]
MTGFALRDLIDDRPEDGVFRVNRALFRDPDLFDLEMKHIFEGGWVFIGLATQAEDPHDYFTGFIGRVPIIVSRDGEGVLHCFVNACPHKGVRLIQKLCGNARRHVCPYHSWTFDSTGANKNIKWQKSGCYGAGFDDENHDLAPVAKFGEYRGFLFASLNADVPSLDEHLGEARKLLDLVVDKSPEGVELVPGRVTFTYAANWKMQLENCSDQYHFTSTHPSYIRILDQRAKEQAEDVVQSSLGASDFWQEEASGTSGGTMSFDHGHVLNWGIMPVSSAIPEFERAEQLARDHGEAKRNWMFNMRNLTIFPNLQIAENASSQMRVIRPLAAGLTEMQTWCIAPRGESAQARTFRIRQYEDFFNPTGMATPDDTVCYEEAQLGMAEQDRPWLQGHARGLTASKEGGNMYADMIELKPARNVVADAQLCDESLFASYYRAWAQRMAEVIA